MPVYEYQCMECGEIQEAFQKISDPPIETCSKCRGHLKKLISQSSFHLKGSGWYVTDYGGAKTGSGKGSEPKEKSNSKSADTASKKNGDS